MAEETAQLTTPVADQTDQNADDSILNPSADEGTLLTEATDEGTSTVDDTQNDTATPEAITYDLKLPENGLVNDTALNDVQEFATKHSLSNDVAQEILDGRNTAIQAQQQASIDEWNSSMDAELERIKSDPDMGGDNLTKSDQTVTALLKRFAPESFIEDLKRTGMAKSYGLFKTLFNIAQSSAQDTLHLGGSKGGAPDNSPEAVASRMFPADKL